jgi:hypothetical protein
MVAVIKGVTFQAKTDASWLEKKNIRRPSVPYRKASTYVSQRDIEENIGTSVKELSRFYIRAPQNQGIPKEFVSTANYWLYLPGKGLPWTSPLN